MAQNQTNNLFPILIIIVGVVAGYLYYSNVTSAVELPPLPAGVARDDLRAFKNLQLDFTFSDNAQFKMLEQFGEFPVNPGVSGKSNIFAPIQ